ncbi:MAG: LysR family transcriptional regulator [Proteobacteria bacterium]|nr:LysR family transcriptional regulator [Pseudomonadota bacterium]
MPIPRIPPVNCLLSFEALARLRSVTKAADELHVTPSAVSHRIRQLETQLKTKLFARSEFALTDEGSLYLEQVRAALRLLARPPGGADADVGTKLRLAVTPTFSRQILLPKLALFRYAYPDIELILQVAIPLQHTTAEGADLEIRYGDGLYAGFETQLVLQDELYPVCSPEYLNEFGPFDGFDTVEQIERAHLIRSPLLPWRHWFDACGIKLPEPRIGSQFNDVGLVLDAAVAGFGVALTRSRLGTAWLESGRLVRLSRRSAVSGYHHYVCWKPGTLERWECAAFVDWIQKALAADRPL